VDSSIADTCDVLNDSCLYTFDAVCDTVGDSPLCNSGTDCFDCDPCLSIVLAPDSSITNSNEMCNLCTAAGCDYCTLPSDDGSDNVIPICTSSSIALSIPNLCSASGGSSYSNTCDGIATTPPPSPNTTIVTPSTCDFSTDLCEYAGDKVCDAPGSTSTGFGSAFCPRNSDCLDCDPCQELRYDGCDVCVAAGCYWCASDALCLSTNPFIDGNITSLQNQLSCTSASDFVWTCPMPDGTKVYNDPLYDAQNWVYEQIGVVDVWKSGISEFHFVHLMH
jgi:hypothetical protein